MKVFYRPEMVAVPKESLSPSAAKPAQVIADWLDHGLIQREDILSFEPVNEDTLSLAHDPAYVRAVMRCEEPNGFGTCEPKVAASLLYTCGSVLTAARYAIQERDIAVSPTSGFHHAKYREGGGFCTFNGLMVTAMQLQREGLISKLLIVDGDAHYGNGTQDIIDVLSAGSWIKHITSMRDFGSYAEFQKAFAHYQITECLGGLPDLVLYQAGADAWEKDPLRCGTFSLTDLIQRDKSVFRWSRKHQIPLVWNLVGGYARDEAGAITPVLDIHRSTLHQALDANS